MLEDAGATVFDIDDTREYPGPEELLVLLYEFKVGLEQYLASSNSDLKTLDELIAFNEENKEEVLKHFDQSHFYDSNETTNQKEEYLIALERVLKTRDEIDNPQNLKLLTKINGTVRQDSTTSNMFIKIPAIISILSKSITLEPGDIISTGTAAGVALNNPNIPNLKDGDQIEMEIENLGTIQNKVRFVD